MMINEGIPHFLSCALCEVRFSLYTELYKSTLNQNDITWVSYYRARK